MPWLSKVKGVLQMWWPGDEGGWATADVLLGNVNPGGKLPFTWGKKLTDYAANDPAHPERSTKGVDGKTTFSEGVDVGYRWFDAQGIEPLYSFGYGLSYTRFRFGEVKTVKAADGGLDVSVDVTNAGDVAGDEVAQVYLDAPAEKPEGFQFAPKTLAAFDRVTLGPKETKTVTMHVAPRAFEAWSAAENKWVRFGNRKVEVGGSERDLKGSAAAE
jgi:beta-glucosidase